MMHRVFIVVLSLFLLVVALATAGEDLVKKGDKPSEDWSRSVVIGEDVSGSLGMAVSEGGDRTHVVWPFEDEEGRKLRLVGLNEAASITVEEDLAYPGHLRSPRLVPAGASRLHLFWATRLAPGAGWQLWHQLLDPDGRPAGEAAMVSREDESIGRYDVYADGRKGVLAVWDGIDHGGISAVRLGPEGKILSGPETLVSQGSNPTFRVDPQGVAHVAWLADRSFYYAEVPLEDLSTIEAVEVVDLDNWGTLNSSGDSLEGPVLGYADGWIYLFWTIVSVTDTEAGSGVAEFAAFPKGSPAYLKPQRIWAIPAEIQPYVESESSLALSQLSRPMQIADSAEAYGVQVQFDNAIAGDWSNVTGAVSSYMLSPATMIGHDDDLGVALAISQDRGSDSHLQIAANVFSKGRNLGYNFAGKTRYLSDNPILATDGQGELFLAWREGAAGETVYFASTTDEARTALDRLEIGDLLLAAPQGIADSVSAIGFAPFAAFCWILPGLLLLGGWQLLRDETSLSRRRNWIPLALALALYYALKLAFLPTFTTYVPLSAWLFIPPALSEPLRLGFPVLILGIAAAAAFAIQRRHNGSLLIFFLSWVAVDGLLTLAFYGVNLLGTF